MAKSTRTILKLATLALLAHLCIAQYEDIILDRKDITHLSRVRLEVKGLDQDKRCDVLEGELRSILTGKLDQPITGRQELFSAMIKILGNRQLPFNNGQPILIDLSNCSNVAGREAEDKPEKDIYHRKANSESRIEPTQEPSNHLELQEEITALRNELSVKKGEITGSNKEVLNNHAEIKGLREQLSVKETEMARLRSELAENRAKTSELRGELSAKTGEITGSSKELLNNRAEINDLRKQLLAKEEEVARLRSDFDKIRAETNGLRGELSVKQEELTGLRDELSVIGGQNKGLRDQLSAKQAEMTDLRGELLANHGQIDGFREQLSVKEKEVNVSRQELKALKDKYAKLEERSQVQDSARLLDAARAEVAEKDAIIKSLQTKQPTGGDDAKDDPENRRLIELAEKLQDTLNPRETPQFRCFKYFLVIDAKQSMTEMQRVVEAVGRSVPNYLIETEKLSKISKMLIDSGVKKAAQTGQGINECFFRETGNLNGGSAKYSDEVIKPRFINSPYGRIILD